MIRPFLVYALPRSRTAWLAQFLTYGAWTCYHELAVAMRSFEDVEEFFKMPNTGTVETGVSPGWALIHHAVPDLVQVVIHRPVDQVIESFRAIDIAGFGHYDFAKLHRNMTHMARGLRDLARRPGVLSIEFDDLATEAACAGIFEHCLPYPFDRAWWELMKDRNIQISVLDQLQYYDQHRVAIDGFKRECKRRLLKLRKSGEISREAIHG